jgi:hypothetical protein
MPYIILAITGSLQSVRIVGLLDGAMHVWVVLYRTTRTKTLFME